MLPTGQILFTDFSNDVELFTSTGTSTPAGPDRLAACDHV